MTPNSCLAHESSSSLSPLRPFLFRLFLSVSPLKSLPPFALSLSLSHSSSFLVFVFSFFCFCFCVCVCVCVWLNVGCGCIQPFISKFPTLFELPSPKFFLMKVLPQVLWRCLSFWPVQLPFIQFFLGKTDNVSCRTAVCVMGPVHRLWLT